MNCQTAESLLHGYFDDELDLVNGIEMERHFATCAACAARLARERALRARLAAGSLRYSAPPHLRLKIASALARSGPVSEPARHLLRPRAGWAGVLAAAALLVAGLVLVWDRPSAESLLAQQIRDSHVRSLMAAHLFDVASSDQHTVKPWFAGKLSFSPAVSDLEQEGFPLAGGRLDYLDNHPAAALVFKRREHVINLFIWPNDSTRPGPPRLLRENGYQLVHWSDSAMNYWTISDLNARELQEFARQVATRANGPAGAPPETPVRTR